MKILNTTIQNRTKQPRLESQHIVPAHYIESSSVARFLHSLPRKTESKERILFSLGCQLLESNRNKAVLRFLRRHKQQPLKFHNVPFEQFDLLGAVYQFLNSKKENLEKGSYYTGAEIAVDLVSDLDFSSNQTMIDPSCGSGSFLFRSKASPDQIYGVDSDPVAIMIATFNYFIKFPTADAPNLYCSDFFEWFFKNLGSKFDYVIGNPPFGANLDLSQIPSLYVTSGESFSFFTEFGCSLVKQGGLLRYVVPQSLLNVKRHADIRHFLLDRVNLRRIKWYPKGFAGVMSDVYMIEVDTNDNDYVQFEHNNRNAVPKDIYRSLTNQIFVQLSPSDIAILRKVEAISEFSLRNSVFGLGVVTGDNRTKLKKIQASRMEPIYTGKEVEKYRLREPENFIKFDRSKLQQVAPDEIYRAPKKLVYKTICTTLRFALDESGALTTNSANIVIPNIPGYDIETVMGFLNSDLYSYLHIKLSGGVNKVGKENLQELPFPSLSKAQNRAIRQLVAEASIAGDDTSLQSYLNRDVFGLSDDEIFFIRNQLVQTQEATDQK